MNKSFYLKFLILFCFNQVSAQSPNFVIIVVDDQGWTGSSVQMDANILGSKSDFYVTPEMESMSQAGITFSQGYAPAPKCAPSRASILTGRTTARNNFTSTDNDIATGKILIEGTTETALDGADITYAEWLKSTGLNYRTAHFGKWHLGSAATSSPSSNGFDFNDGNTNNSNGNQGGTVQTDPKKIFDLTNRSISFIQDAVTDGVPFLLQLSHYAVHNNIEARQETIDLYNDPSQRPLGTLHTNIEYGAMTEDTDDGIGQLLAEITNLGLDSNTYIMLISDNGGQLGNLTDNTPLAFGKTFLYEGGIRVPFIIKGPNITSNSYNTEAVVEYDLFPTIAELTGSSLALPANIDGQSLVPLLTGNTFNRTAPIYFHSPHYDINPNKTPRSAVIDGQYKLVVTYETGNISLYDLSTDIGETTDISASQASIAQELCIKLRDHLKAVNATMPTLDPTNALFSGAEPDVDNDGLDDAWEFRELLSYTYGPNDDPDNDGDNNITEFMNGTDPYSLNTDVDTCDPSAIFANETTNAVCFDIVDHVRKCYTNNIPAHQYGPFGGMNTIAGQDFEYSMCLYPELTTTATEIIEDPSSQGCGGGTIFGVSDQGVNYSPFARLYWVNPNTQEENLDWHVEADFTLNMDLNGGHVNNVSRYHYHNIPTDYFNNDLNIDGSTHSPLLGYAADGFPIYYKYLYSDPNDVNSNVSSFNSSFQLKSGSRPGDGITAPNGIYDGNYVEDYDYNNAISELDECGGRFGVTPDYPEGTYYYVLTDNWPYIPRCMKGMYVDNSFKIGPNCPDSTAVIDCSNVALSIQDLLNSNIELTVYPNPTNNYFNIKLSNDLDQTRIKGIRIFSSNAKMVYSSDTYQETIQVNNYSKGLYFIQIDFDNNQITKKLIIH
ncbi:YHYH protein [Lacinutrix jangbogonensis]|uniref:YHYH protein n=1 Tax=Lacinutrix jangbogonensis TaxID=1469557 RepID=UPI0009DCA38F|nr:YHYH protein [Lacinutrix jangbogonensis]